MGWTNLVTVLNQEAELCALVLKVTSFNPAAQGFCLLCHSGPFSEEPLQGNLAPSLAGAGSRWNKGQLRLRLMDNKRINPESIMPAYHRIEGLNRVGPVWRDRPILSAAEIEDVLAFLTGLTAEKAP